MRSLLHGWNTFWFRPISARPLGAFRVIVGSAVLIHLALLGVDLDYWLTDRGIMMGTEAWELAGPFRYSPLQYVQDPPTVRAFFAATMVVALLFTLGWRTRIVSVLLYLALLSIHHRNIPTNCGPDILVLLLVFYLMFSPCGAAYSLDARRIARKRGTIAEPLIIPWAQRLIQLQLCLVYFNTAMLKCNGVYWFQGTALHYVLNNDEVTRFNFTWLSAYPVLLNLLSHSSLFLEFALPFLIWFRPTRRLVIFSGLAFHGSICLMINVPIFGELTMACYLTFLSPEEFDSLRRILNPWNWFRARETRPPSSVPDRRDAAESLRGPHRPSPIRAEESGTTTPALTL